MKNTSESSKKITDKNEISKIISEISDNSKATSKESVSDQPVNVDDYIIVTIHHKNADGNPSVAYLYKDKENSYVEQPYAGIWKFKNEMFESICDLIR